MSGFLSEFERDLLNTVSVVISIAGILLSFLFRLLPARVVDAARKHVAQVFNAFVCILKVSLKVAQQARERIHTAFKDVARQTGELTCAALKPLAGKATNLSFEQINICTRTIIFVVSGGVVALVAVTLLYSMREQVVNMRREAEAVAQCQRFEYRLTRNPDEHFAAESTLELSCGGHRVYHGGGWHLRMRSFDHEGPVADVMLEAGQQEVRGTIPAHDITGDNAPDILLVTHSGGSCCGNEYELLSLGPVARSVVKIEQTKYEEEAQFEDVNGDGIYEIRRDDLLSRNWEGSYFDVFATFPVVLALRDGEYRMEPRLMQQSPPSESELWRMAEAVRAARGNEEGTSIYPYLMKLTYEGNGHEAQKLIDLVFIDMSSDERRFLWREFQGMLANSLHWPDLASMNGWSQELNQYASMESCPY